MIVICLMLLTFVRLTTVSQVPHDNCPPQGHVGNFSRLSVDLCFEDVENERRHLEIASPDHSLRLVVDGRDGEAYAQGQKVGQPIGIMREEEVIWSPDSRAILFTLSFGAAGPISADFRAIRNPSLADNRPSVTQTIRADFASRHSKDRCHQEPNIAGLTWLDGSGKAVFVAEVPPSPQCEKDGGYFEGYVVSFQNGEILERLSMKKTIQRWHKVLGSRLQDDIALLRDH